MSATSDPTGLVGRFAHWGAALDYVAIPPKVRRAARRALVDTLGVMVAGTRHPALVSVRAAFPAGQGACSVTGGGPAGIQAAALVNGTAAHVWDFDDTSYTGIMHGSAVVFPAVLAVAQDRQVDDAALLTAFVAGSEIAYTLADIAGHGHYFQGWWSTGTFGLVGATAGVARLLGLSAGQTAHALAMAAAGAGGGRVVMGTDAKPFLVGETARRAVDFAQAAGAGIRGPAMAFEDPRGFFALLNQSECDHSQADTLGRRWRLIEPGLLFKQHPVCSAAQAAIEQTALLMSESGLDAGDIGRIHCEIPELVAISLVHDDPQNAQEAQFSLPFAVARAALDGTLSLAHLTETAIQSPDVRRLMSRIDAHVAEDLSSEDMRRQSPECARIAIEFRDGSRSEGFCGAAYGMPSRPMSDQDLLAKFEHCLVFAGVSRPADSFPEALLSGLGERPGADALASIARILDSSRQPRYDDPS